MIDGNWYNIPVSGAVELAGVGGGAVLNGESACALSQRAEAPRTLIVGPELPDFSQEAENVGVCVKFTNM